MKLRTTISLFLLVGLAFAKTKDSGRPSCSVLYAVVQQDTLGNFQENLTQAKDSKWADSDLRKKYPDICYSTTGVVVDGQKPKFEIVDSPDQAPPAKVVFFISVMPATYYGTWISTTRSTVQAPTSGTVTDNSGQQIGTYEGTTTTTSTSSTAVPYSYEYGKYTLIIERIGSDGKSSLRHIFQQDGLGFHGRGHHPVRALIEDAVRWIHSGGLDDPLQSVQNLSR